MSYAQWRERLLKGVDTSLFPAEWLDLRVANGSARCWSHPTAAILAEIKIYPSGVREVHGLVASGDIETIKTLITKAEEWGRMHGARQAVISSVPAWQRLMRDAGYSHYQTTIVKDL